MCVQESRRAGKYLGRRGQEKKQNEVLCSHETRTLNGVSPMAVRRRVQPHNDGMGGGGGLHIPSRGQHPTADAKRIHISLSSTHRRRTSAQQIMGYQHGKRFPEFLLIRGQSESHTLTHARGRPWSMRSLRTSGHGESQALAGRVEIHHAPCSIPSTRAPGLPWSILPRSWRTIILV